MECFSIISGLSQYTLTEFCPFVNIGLCWCGWGSAETAKERAIHSCCWQWWYNWILHICWVSVLSQHKYTWRCSGKLDLCILCFWHSIPKTYVPSTNSPTEYSDGNQGQPEATHISLYSTYEYFDHPLKDIYEHREMPLL